MIQISLTSFVDFVSKSGTPKVTVVQNVITQLREGYDPVKDFWKTLRDAIVEMHRHKKPKSDLDMTLKRLTDVRRSAAYPEAESR